MKRLIDKLERERALSRAEFEQLIGGHTPSDAAYLFERARKVREREYGNAVYIRGLIEFTSYCKNDCLYCGLRRSNRNAERYRLSREQILQCCGKGYELGFRTFVLQGGEDPAYTDGDIADIVRAIKRAHPDCAVTLSLGERGAAAYRLWREAGADRYLLRHETADAAHYARLHPPELSLRHRMDCLFSLRKCGYQVGTGFMVGSPGQTPAALASDLLFIQQLRPQMVGIGPFVPHHDTPFANQPGGSCEQTVFMLGLLRLMQPGLLLPATTALGTIDPQGREKGMLAGANVVMPNLSPIGVRKKYLLYDNKICTGDEAAECLQCLGRRMASVGCRLAVGRGDSRVPCPAAE